MFYFCATSTILVLADSLLPCEMQDLQRVVLPALLQVLQDPSVGPGVPPVLSQLLRHHADLPGAACDADAISPLVALLSSPTSHDAACLVGPLPLQQ